MFATKAALASGAITHGCFRCGFRMFFLGSARWCCRWRGQRCGAQRLSARAGAGSTWRSRRGRPACQRDQFRFRGAVKNTRPGGARVVFSAKDLRTASSLPRPVAAGCEGYWRGWYPAPRRSDYRSSPRLPPTRRTSTGCAPERLPLWIKSSS
jgi:hypothetical protein